MPRDTKPFTNYNHRFINYQFKGFRDISYHITGSDILTYYHIVTIENAKHSHVTEFIGGLDAICLVLVAFFQAAQRLHDFFCKTSYFRRLSKTSTGVASEEEALKFYKQQSATECNTWITVFLVVK